MRSLFLSLILSSLVLSCLAQPEERIEIRSLNRQLIKKKDTVYRFYAVLPDHPVRLYPDRTYYWFHSDTILTTVGGYDGRLLDGTYTVFYPDRNLAIAGEFVDGLRNGEWRSWYPGGVLRSIMHWREGLESGPFIEFSKEGRKLREGQYKKGLLYGKVRQYTDDGQYQTIAYKNGIPVDGEPVKKKEKKEKKKGSQDED